MRVLRRQWPLDVRLIGGMAVIALCVVLMTFAMTASGAPMSAARGVARNSLCSVSKSVARDIVRSSKLAGPTSTPHYLKTVYGKISAAEPKILGAASGTIKTDFTKVFGFVNTVIRYLRQANWNVLGLAAHQKTLEADARKVAPDLRALKRYYTSTCRFKV